MFWENPVTGRAPHPFVACACRGEKNDATSTKPAIRRRQHLPEGRGAGPETGVERHLTIKGFKANRGCIPGARKRLSTAPGAKRASAVAVPPRIYSRVDNAYRMERHYVRGMMRLRLGLVTVVMMALGHLRAERQDSMRSLVDPVGLPG